MLITLGRKSPHLLEPEAAKSNIAIGPRLAATCSYSATRKEALENGGCPESFNGTLN
jgi:hypothetical protein